MEKVLEIEILVNAACVNVRKMQTSNDPYLEKFGIKTFSCESFMQFYNAAFTNKMIAYKRKDSGHCIPKFPFLETTQWQSATALTFRSTSVKFELGG